MKYQKLLLMVMVICMAQMTFAQGLDKETYLNNLFTEAEIGGADFQTVDLFSQLDAQDVKASRPDLQPALEEGTVLIPQQGALNQLVKSSPQSLTLTLPRTNADPVTVELVKVNLFAPGFEVRAASTDLPVEVDLGVQYHGRIQGKPGSLVAISIFDNEISGMINYKGSTLVLGKLEGRQADNAHILYDDRYLKASSNFDCETPDDDFIGYSQEQLNGAQEKATGDCVVLYIEVANDIHNNKGGISGATSYAINVFNQSFALYSAEQINFSFGAIVVWDTPDPYTGTSSSAQLSQFQANVSSIGGATLGHLISYEASGGIAAGFAGVCNSNVDNSLCFSSIEAGYNDVPTYSWSVMVVTHEMGHLLGSRHTHACVWNGNNTAIDGCAGQTEGSCALPGYPSGGGTLMSYCHLQSVGINFNNGFGPQPGSVIRSTLQNSTCTSACAAPTCSDNIRNGDETGVDCGGSCPNICPIEYCTSGGSNSSFEWINSVNIGSISNTSGNNGGYGDYTSVSTSEDQGATVNVALNAAFSGTTYGENWAVFVDFNADGDFSDSGENVFNGSTTSTETLSGSFTVPNDASLGNTRMRVVMAWNTAALACGTVSYGETEDYGFAVTAASGPTCTDGIQNGNETGVDCGGPDCPACPTCFDGIQNQGEEDVDCGGPCPACPTCFDGVQNGDETGVDCGGPDCPACPTCNDGIQNGSETDVDCGGPDCPACPTCNDGIQNGSETDVDCGGPDCPACPTCTDGIQNGDETGVDCGGSCPACPPDPTCTDGVQNGNETGVDCGGPDCPACPTCTDGIQNGDETGVDCGGSCPACPPDPTCTDGVQNGNETGVDCGGPDCPACPTCTDGIQNGSETDVDCGGPDCPACPTCTDGIQNGDETGVDCGGSCPACPPDPTCTDGVQNGNETGVDCGGPDCPACPTCTDGVQNGSETDVDCGGPDCPACPTCSDGIQNGDEEGIDCGGSCPNACDPGGCTDELINFNNFNSTWGIWNDGGSDCRRSSKDAAYAVGGTGRPVRLRDNTSTSVMTTDLLNLSGYDELTINFSFIARSMDNSNEDFWFQVSGDGGSSYTTVMDLDAFVDFSNNVRYNVTLTVPGPFTSNSRLRFRCDASGNSDWVYIDDVEIIGCNNGTSLVATAPESRPEAEKPQPGQKDIMEPEMGIQLFPNPASSELNIRLTNAEASIPTRIFDLNGRIVWTGQMKPGSNQIDISDLAYGMYYLTLMTDEGQLITQKFIKTE